METPDVRILYGREGEAGDVSVVERLSIRRRSGIRHLAIVGDEVVEHQINNEPLEQNPVLSSAEKSAVIGLLNEMRTRSIWRESAGHAVAVTFDRGGIVF